MEQNGFHLLENEFPLAAIRFVFKKWFPLISVTLWLVETNSQIQ